MDNEGKIIEEENYDFSMGNFVFTENNGKEMTFTKEIQNSRVSCAHTYVTGEYKKHIRNSTGGCKIIIYRAKRCSKCGSIQIIKRLNTATIKSITPKICHISFHCKGIESVTIIPPKIISTKQIIIPFFALESY